MSKSNKAVAGFFFSPHGDKDNHSHICKLCQKVKVQKLNTGYQNLIDHLERQHPDYMSDYDKAIQSSPEANIMANFTNKKG